MTCEHLRKLEEELLASGMKETYRGTPWTDNCREWVYFDVVLDTHAVKARMGFAPCVTVHENLDPRSGTERGFYCTRCRDAIIGLIKGESVYK